MKVEAPPGRYRIFERERRLVVIDTHSGEEISARPGATPVATPPAASPGLSRPSALAPVDGSLTRHTNRVARVEKIDQEKAKRIAIVAAASLALGIFLIVTNLWIGVLLVALVAPLRNKALPVVRDALLRYINQPG